MRRKPLLPILAMLLAVASCQRSEIAPSLPDKDASARKAATTTDDCDVLNFTSGNTFNLNSGALISTTSEDGLVVRVAGGNPEMHNAARIFNSSAPHPEDKDLGTPNIMYPGGVGEPSGAASNNTALGNIAIIQDANYTEPNDADVNGSSLQFFFPSPITATSIQVIDVEAAESEGGIIRIYRATSTGGGSQVASFPIPDAGSNGVATIDLGNTPEVSVIAIFFNGSMGFDNLRFCSPPPPPTELNCTYTQGYWKNHEEAWDVQSLTIGGTSYSKAQLLDVLKTAPKKGNAVLILAHQLIAAKLNLANDAGASLEVQEAITDADALLQGINITSGYSKSDEMKEIAATLDKYNNGLLGNEHCD